MHLSAMIHHRSVSGIAAALLLLLLPVVAAAQLSADTARGLVGRTISLPLYLEFPAGSPGPNPVTLHGRLRLGNATVFYPQRFIAPAGDSLLGFMLHAEKDSIYTFSFTIDRAEENRVSGDTLVYLAGEALAGSDSVCILYFETLEADSRPLDDATGAVITRSIGPPLPYVRFATLEQNYPNPATRGRPTIFAYRIDKRSDVRFHIYNLMGQELFVAQLGDTDIGPHTFVFLPEPTMPSGAYLVRLVTNSGSADKVMHILQ